MYDILDGYLVNCRLRICDRNASRGHYRALAAISTDFPDHIVRKLSCRSTPRWSFDHRPRVFASTPIIVFSSRIFRAFGRREALLSRYKSMWQRDRYSLSPGKRSCGMMGVPRFIAGFGFARTSDTRRRLIADRYRAHGKDASVRGARFSSARGVCLR